MRRVLLTGATGFIGRHCIEPLLARGYEVHGVCRRRSLEDRRLHAHSCDLLQPSARGELLANVRPDALLHLAWDVIPGKYLEATNNRDWLSASRALLDEFIAAGGKRFVAAGTCFEYDWSGGVCDEQSTPLRPSTFYGTCKNELREYVVSRADAGKVSCAWGRVFFLYGPHEAATRLVPSVISALVRGEPAECTSGDQVRDFLHVADVGSAFAALLDSDVQGPVNISSGEPVTVREVVETIARTVGRTELLRLGALPTPAHEPARIVGRNHRLRNEAGWRSQYTLASGIEQTVSWWRQEMRIEAGARE